MIKIDRLTKTFGNKTAVNQLSFDINAGEIVGFLGPNGAGKSTTMKMISGFLPMTSGDVSINGHSIQRHPIEIKSMIGYLPEGAPAYGEMTVFQFLTFVARARGVARNDRKSAIMRVVSMVELSNVLDERIDNLSKGFKRRVGIAQALIHDPQILILDEPTDGLDPNQKHQVRTLIQNLAKDKIVIVSTHILEEVSAVCNRAIIISDGELKFDGTPDELISRSEYHNAISLKLSFAADISGLLELPGVRDMVHDPQTNTVTVFPENGQNISATINEFAQRQHLPVDMIFPRQGRLDEVFRQITQQTS